MKYSQYDPKKIEQTLYKSWEKKNLFVFINNPNKKNYCIMIPPPNITGNLHLGHAFQYTFIDTLIRYKRMLGKNTLWITGIDHAGIATEIIVEQQNFYIEGKRRNEYSKQEFIKKILAWKQQSKNNINNQMKRLGNAIDWTKERFTMDHEMSKAVQEVFIKLYQDKLIYRNKKMINWDPTLQTVISDLEITNKKTKGSMWYINYPLVDNDNNQTTANKKKYITVATTRPETLLGDVAIAVNPIDNRYKNLIGKFVILPIINCNIPIIAEKHIDITQGTGCVKVTPAHDFKDYEIAIKNKLPIINIFTKDNKIKKQAEISNIQKNIKNFSRNIPKHLQGLEKKDARKKIISILDNLNYLHDIQPHIYNVPYGERSGAIIEPMLTDQWYIKTTSLAKQAIQAVKNDTIEFIPKKYKKTYFNWMNNIQDWCISRQIWWGHPIPAWYDNLSNKIYVGHSEDEIRKKYQLDKDIILIKDQDVLDTWFSSSLWTFAGLGWPNDLSLLKTCHPTDIMVSGFDIIFFWIARMIMLTMYFIKNKNKQPQIPFKKVYITGLIRDKNGQKMSKSKGNTIDPVDLIDGITTNELIKKRMNEINNKNIQEKIEKTTKKQFPLGIKPYGADALRFTMAALSSTSRDIIWDIKRLEGYRNFCNKIWNASNFVIMNTENKNYKILNSNKKIFSQIDRWIFTKFHLTIKSFQEQLNKFRLDNATKILHEFIWHQFCDWYLEFAKITIQTGSSEEIQETQYTLITIFESLLRLAHPIIPFITETIWQKIQKIIGNNNPKSILMQPFPKHNQYIKDLKALSEIEWIKNIIITIRTIQKNIKIQKNKPISILFLCKSTQTKKKIQDNLKKIISITKIKNILLISKHKNNYPQSLSFTIKNLDILIPIELLNINEEINKINKELIETNTNINNIKDKINNKSFIKNAPKNIILKEQKKLKNYQKKYEQLLKHKQLMTKK